MSFFSPKRVYWIKTLSKFVSVQLLVQVLGFASGLLLVRTLDQNQYAYFTIANSMQTTMNILADTGIGMSLSAVGGKVWQDRYRFGQLINTAMQLRYYLAAIAVTVVTPILIWLLLRSGAPLASAIFITAAVLLGLAFELTAGVLIVVPRLRSQISRVRNLELFAAIARLALLGGAYLTLLNAAVSVAIASFVTGLRRFILVRWADENVDKTAPVSKEDRQFILSTAKNVAPLSIFFCIQGQLSIFLISFFGNTQNVAEVGALGRLGIVFVIVQSVMTNIVLPSFARCQEIESLRRRYFQILGGFILFGIGLIGISALFPSEILWILGNKYSHLQGELLLMIFSFVVGSIVGVMSSLNSTKAWVQYAWIEIPIRLTLQAILLIHLDVSTVTGVILFTLLTNISPFVVNAFLSYQGLTQKNT